MSEWDAEYVITHVRYVGHHIENVRRWRIEDGHLVDPVEVSREIVAQDLEIGLTYRTAIQEDDEWIPGDRVTAFDIDGDRYLRTKAGDNPADNLGGLPEF
ncbi:DUF3892 domain-containing protein [Haloparvum sp. AD34]